jgi:inhibitor of KinA
MNKYPKTQDLNKEQDFELVPLGDSAIVVILGDQINVETHNRVKQLAYYLEHNPFEGMVEYVPTFTTVTIFYEAISLISASEDYREDKSYPYLIAVERMKSILIQLKHLPLQSAKIIEIPVCYGGEFGPDLETVAAHNSLSIDEIITIHSTSDYLVYMLGFAPGFAYLGGMSEKIATPRRQTPRLSIPSGTVGIAGEQTGVYPIETPGGWQLIGKTPVSLFLPKSMPPTLIEAGNIVRFYPISRDAFDHWGDRNQ